MTFEQLRDGGAKPNEPTEFEILRGDADWGSLQGYEPQSSDPSQLPDYEKLTRTERWLVNKLPGFADSGVGKALIKFNDSWVGKALMVLDVGAEGLERLAGLSTQWGHAWGHPEEMDVFIGNLKEAWQASSLASDFARIPIYRDGRWQITHDLPGIGGLLEARKRLIDGESLEEVQASMYDGLGTLAIRAQKQDAVQHILADPMWLINSYVKPIEFLKLGAIRRASQLALPGEIAETTGLISRLGGVVNKFDDTANLASEVKKLQKVAKTAEEISDLQKLKNIIDDLPRVGQKTNKAGLLDELDQVIRAAENMKVMKPWEQKLQMFLGNTMGFEKPWAELSGWQRAWLLFVVS